MQIFKPGSIVVVLGPGGVGKTTIAAALGLAAAGPRHETTVITVDPARRLRDALGLSGSGARTSRLDPRRLRTARLDAQLKLSVTALDVKATWNSLVKRFVVDRETQQRIFANSFYRNLTERFAGAESVAALELLRTLHEERRATIEIVDTPPAMQAFDLLEAPERLTRLIDSKTARWILQGLNAAGSNLPLAGRAARIAIGQIEQVAGISAFSAMAEFLSATAAAAIPLRQRMASTAGLLRSGAASFVLVTTAAPDRLREAEEIAAQMREARLDLRLVVVNRLGDESIFVQSRLDRSRVAALLRQVEMLRPIAADGIDRCANDLIEYLAGYLTEQGAALERVGRFSRRLSPRIEVTILPEMGRMAGDLAGLARLAAILTDGLARRRTPRCDLNRSAAGERTRRAQTRT